MTSSAGRARLRTRPPERQCRRIVATRSNGLCERCGMATATDMHHRKNRSAGGLWEPSNIVHLCRSCHRWVTVNPNAAADEGLHLPAWKDPERVGVIYVALLWVRLDKSGETERLARICPSPPSRVADSSSLMESN